MAEVPVEKVIRAWAAGNVVCETLKPQSCGREVIPIGYSGAHLIMPIAARLVIVALTACVLVAPVSAQTAARQVVKLEAQPAARSLDAMPAVFAVARNLEGIEIAVGVDDMANGFSDLADQAAAQEQLTNALSAYGFEGYDDWAETVRAVFSTYASIRSNGPSDPAIKEALQEVLDDPGMPRGQKDAIIRSMDEPRTGFPKAVASRPTRENLVVVMALIPQIKSTIEMISAMQ